MFKVALFDVDGVILVGEKFSTHLEREYGVSHEKTRTFFTGEFRDCLTGKCDLKVAMRRQLGEWGLEGSVDELMKYWYPKEEAVNRPLLDVVAALRSQGVLCYLATNQEKHRIEYLMQDLGFAELFDGVFASSEMGVCKPDPVFFERIIESLAPVTPGDVLYWDDDLKNVTVATDLGIVGKVYSDYDRFTIEMTGLGFIK